jgi:hypothetical protein
MSESPKPQSFVRDMLTRIADVEHETMERLGYGRPLAFRRFVT